MVSNSSKCISFRDEVLSKLPSGKIICIRNCRLFQNGSFDPCQDGVSSQELWIRDGIVLEPQKIFYSEQRRPDLFVDCEDLILAPGFLDIQVNGAFGVDFTSLVDFDQQISMQKLAEVAAKILRFGITGFCATIITARPDAYKMFLNLLNVYKQQESSKSCAQILGAHFEGPFISTSQLGCHPKSLAISSMADNALEQIYGTNFEQLAYVTLAPELPEAEKAIELLCGRGVKVAMGHTNATHTEAQNAMNAGITSVTHLFNSMRPFGKRDPGIFGLMAASEKGPIYNGIISDGIHVADLAILLAFCANSKGAIVVTDCIAALGLGDGMHPLGEVTVRVQGNVAKVDGTDFLAGSVSSMPNCMRHFAKVLDNNKNSVNGLAEALKAATFNPANFLGIANRMGTLNVGTQADFVLIDDQLEVIATFVGGTKCYQSDQ